MAFIELLGNHNADKTDEKGRQYIRIIAEASQKLAQMMDDLLAFSRMGKEEMHQSQEFWRRSRERIRPWQSPYENKRQGGGSYERIGRTAPTLPKFRQT